MMGEGFHFRTAIFHTFENRFKTFRSINWEISPFFKGFPYPDEGRVGGEGHPLSVLVVRGPVEVPGAAQPEAAQGLRLELQRGPGGGHQHPRTLRRALQLLPGRALGGGEGGLHTLGVGGAVDQGAGTLEVGLHPASAAGLGTAGVEPGALLE